MAKFIKGGFKRYAHQVRGLQKMIETKGITALLYSPGTGKTATTLDFASLLTLTLPPLDDVKEARVLVIAPLAAVDTWVSQSEEFVSPQVNYWAEALGGTILQRGEALAARGGNSRRKDPKPKKGGSQSSLHVEKSLLFGARTDNADFNRTQGPEGLGNDKPRMTLLSINLDSFSSRRKVGSGTMADFMLDSVVRFAPDLIVVDESHKIKSNSSNVSRLLGRIATRVKRRIILTGTVMPAGPLDVYGQWRFLDPYAFGTPRPDGSRKVATFTEFKDRYAQMGGFMGREVVGFKNLDDMQDIMARNAIVATKEDSLDLPPITDTVIKVNMTPQEQKAYVEMKKKLVVRIQDDQMASTENRLTQMLRLRQITSGHLPLDDGTTKNLGSSKVNAINSLVHDTLTGEDRIVIFCLFTHEIAALKEKLKKSGTEVYVIQGSTPDKERLRIRQLFGSEDPRRIVLVAQITTLSLSVNELITASHAIFGSMTQRRDEYIQARDRLNRIGQTKPVTYWNMVAPGTIDEVVMQSHKDRTDLEAAVLNHILEEHE